MRWEKTLSLFPKYPTKSYKLFDEIVVAYEDKHRVYHSTDHLLHVFATLDMFFHDEEFQLEIELALWYHDFVYVIGSQHNEKKSANIAGDRLCGLLPHTLHVEQFILKTQHAYEPTDRPSKIVADVDLAILGESPEIYEHYEQAVRKEYAMFHDYAYNRGRRQVLLDFYNRPKIFHTQEMINFGYEDRARINLARVLGKAA
jgi:predicted metal-dependent HD superfamily phosphohydrolase